MTDTEQLAADRVLVARVLSLAPGADRELISILARIARPILRRVVAAHDVEPVLSDLSGHVWDRNWAVLRRWNQEAPLGRYLATVARNFAIDSKRRSPQVDNCPEDDREGVEPHWMADPERVQQVLDASQCLERATERLSDTYKTVVRLRHLQELGHQEIADQLGKTTGYVGPTLARAEKALREALLDRCRELVESLIGARGAAHG
jgi:RNA polymerase sigma factor (sigma-70 family)